MFCQGKTRISTQLHATFCWKLVATSILDKKQRLSEVMSTGRFILEIYYLEQENDKRNNVQSMPRCTSFWSRQWVGCDTARYCAVVTGWHMCVLYRCVQLPTFPRWMQCFWVCVWDSASIKFLCAWSVTGVDDLPVHVGWSCFFAVTVVTFWKRHKGLHMCTVPLVPSYVCYWTHFPLAAYIGASSSSGACLRPDFC